MGQHEREELEQLNCWVITVSDSRTAASDLSGKLIRDRLRGAGHRVLHHEIVKDDPAQIRKVLEAASATEELQVVILSGGTGLAKRDVTARVVREHLDRELEGFGELFRYLSYGEVGPFAMLSQATAGTMGNKLVFSLPGSKGAVRLAMDRLIIPVLGHAVYELEKDNAEGSELEF